MALSTIRALLSRDLLRLKTEIELYQNEERIWQVEKNISNSAGNLCLHLVGNLNAYIGSVIGKTDYIRQRELEFSLKNIPRKDLINMVDATIQMVASSLDKITEEELPNEYPLLVFEKKTSTEFFLIHLSTHLGYHLGQINYHRRLLDS